MKWTLLAAAGLTGCFVLGYLARTLVDRPQPPGQATQTIPARQTSLLTRTTYEPGTAPAEPAAQADHGKELAEKYCASCHLFPEPRLLSLSSWLHHIMPMMALKAGVEPVNYESFKEGSILQAAAYYPENPMIPEADWYQIWDYFRRQAPRTPLPQPPKPPSTPGLDLFRVRKVKFHEGAPMICLVQIDPAGRRFYVGDSYAGLLAVVDPSGRVLRTVRTGSGPVSLFQKPEGFYMTLIGRFFPSDMLEGSLVSWRGQEEPPTPVLPQLRRPTDTVMADLDQDGRDDLVVCQFGNLLGQFSWFRNLGNGKYQEEVLLERPGATRAEVRDFNGDGRPDIMVLTAQAREGIFLFENLGHGQFQPETILEQPPLFGYVHFQLLDWNRDGRLDLLTVNGDNGDNPTPHKFYHGLRLYLNEGGYKFRQIWFYPMEGAFKAHAADFDGDGDLDMAAISFYPDFAGGAPENFTYLENQGQLQFLPRTFPENGAGRWIAMDANDLDGDGDVDILLGAFDLGPTTIRVPETVRDQWKQSGAAVLVLENQLHR